MGMGLVMDNSLYLTVYKASEAKFQCLKVSAYFSIVFGPMKKPLKHYKDWLKDKCYISVLNGYGWLLCSALSQLKHHHELDIYDTCLYPEIEMRNISWL